MNIITAKNYFTKCLRSISGEYSTIRKLTEVALINGASKHIVATDLCRLSNWCDVGHRSQHFAIPDGGVLFDDNWKGLEASRDLELPFNEITIEWYEPKPINEQRLIIACKSDSGDILYTYYCCGLDDECSGEWFTSGSVGVISSSLELFDTSKSNPLPTWYEETKNRRDDGKSYVCKSTPGFQMFQGVDASFNEAARCDMHQAQSTLMEFIEASMCSNVSTDTLYNGSDSANRKRIKKGKDPIQDTKCLVVEIGEKNKTIGVSAGGKHSSPRQHLRRGHIRNLPSGKTVWVNSCVVGKKSSGKIKKTYQFISN